MTHRLPQPVAVPARVRAGWWAAPFGAALVAAAAWLMLGHAPVHAQPGGPPPARPGVEEGIRWRELSPPQRAALAPLEREWSGIDASRKQKWVEIAGRYQRMNPDEQQRMQARMTEWAKLTPQQRTAARLNYQEAKQVPMQDRRSSWDAYQALPPEKRKELAERAAPESRAEGRRVPGRAEARSADTPQPKMNLVPNPAYAAPPKPVAPTVVRAGPGATTTLINKRPAPPSHQQTGLPKINATPEFVNRSTLLPQRGPQAATPVPRAAPPRPAAQPQPAPPQPQPEPPPKLP